ncbi:MAG: SGNH/GDSL hydrolase family protein [Pirellulaceae bacterium]
MTSSLSTSQPAWAAVVLTAICLHLSVRSDETHPVVAPFDTGDRVVFVGDSITAWGQYTAIVHLFYQTRFPDRKFNIYNAALSGDTAFHARLRAEPTGSLFQNDILRSRPNVAVIMLGMNDSRHLDIWGQPAEVRRERLAKAAETYRTSMDELIAKLEANGVRRLIPVISCPYDESTTRGKPPLTGKNGFIRDVTGDYLRQVAARRGATPIDLNSPMLTINVREQARDPRFSLADMGDRVHPLEMGHFVMAYLFLKAMGIEPTVTTLAIDAAEGEVLAAKRCEVFNVYRSATGLRFDCLAGSLPFPTTAFSFQGVVPFDEELNQEQFQVTGLAPGSYAVSIDSVKIGVFAAQQLNRGINLALHPHTPQQQQALEVKRISARSWQASISKRHLIWHQRLMHIRKLDTKEKQIAWLTSRTPPTRAVNREREEEFLRLLEDGRLEEVYAASLRQAEALNDQAYAACTPRKRTYELIRVSD